MTAGTGQGGLQNAALAACQMAALGDQEVPARLAGYLDAATTQAQFDISLEPA